MNGSFEHIPTSIDFYWEGDLKGLDLDHLCHDVIETTRLPSQVHRNIYNGISEEETESIAKEFARAKVIDPGKRCNFREPLQAEIDYERRRIKEPHWKIFGILYEGIWYQKELFRLVSKERLNFDRCPIVFTNQLFGTWDRDDRRYHARVSLYGFPHLISITGLVEAPAKPKAFYLKRQMGIPIELLKEEYQGRFIDHGDPRTTEVLKGYVMQALFFHLSGEPFCEDPDCRLFNSHWQEEVLHSQMDGRYECCPRHETLLRELRDRSSSFPPLQMGDRKVE